MELSKPKKLIFSKIKSLLLILPYCYDAYSAAWIQPNGQLFLAIEKTQLNNPARKFRHYKNNLGDFVSKNSNLSLVEYLSIFTEYGLSNKFSVGSESNFAISSFPSKSPIKSKLSKSINIPFQKNLFQPLLDANHHQLQKGYFFLKKNLYKGSNSSFTLKSLIGINYQEYWLPLRDETNFTIANTSKNIDYSLIYGATIAFGKSFKILKYNSFIDLEVGSKKSHKISPIVNLTYGIKNSDRMYLLKYIYQDEKEINQRFKQHALYLYHIKYDKDQNDYTSSIFFVDRVNRRNTMLSAGSTQKMHSQEIGISLGIWASF